MLSKENESVNCSFKLPETGIIPGTHYGWNIMNNANDLITNNIDIYVDYNSNEIQLFNLIGEELILIDSFNINNIINDYFFEIPYSKKYPISIDIFSQVALINFNGREQLDRFISIDNPKKYFPHKELYNQIEVLEKALDYIKISCPSIINYFIDIDNSFVPLVPPEGALPSSSNSSVDTMFWYSSTHQPLLMAEMIIHELSHQRLFRLQDTDPLLNPEVHGSGWDLCEIYSPWRDDPRPVNGVFHGFVVFTEAAKFWMSLINQGGLEKEDLDISKRRMTMLALQLDHAQKSLATCTYTALGKSVFDAYAQVLEGTILPYIQKHNLGDLKPFFMEFHDQEQPVGISIGEVVEGHKSQWIARNGGRK
jgi:hypothetical protein